MSVCDSLVVKIVTGKTILNKLQHIINTLLLMPISFCALIGVYVHLQHTRLRSDEYWLGMMFVAIAGVTFIFAIVGAFGGRKKDRLLLMVHMIGTGFCVVGLTACCFISYYAVGKVEQDYPVSSEEEVQDVACDSGQSTCCCCDEVVNSTTGYYSDDRCKVPCHPPSAILATTLTLIPTPTPRPQA
uniref:Uncharacterized protein n=2 Tax=Phaeomonas parva TaxID=124430 RepID=A0A7S1XLY4_9STRA|mmetsp:Transcript_2032/g.6093  ORF Transcript_2032/g.6093 Transcript_2032/m.6093 type:complete len:186 (+) Transcript_2032:179-736(+)